MEQNENKDLSFKLDVYEGPLDLLLKLISKNKVSIYDIPIALIFDQYMEYIEQMRMLDMDIAGEFISMASELMLIKSRMLLPSSGDEEEEDPRAALAASLAAYKKAKEAAGYLSQQYSQFGGRMIKDTDEIDVDPHMPGGQEIELLLSAFERISRRRKLADEAITDIGDRALNEIVTKKITPIHVKIFEILKYMIKSGKTDFETLMENNKTRSDMIASFMAMLSLISTRQLIISGETDEGDPVLEINHDRRKPINNA